MNKIFVYRRTLLVILLLIVMTGCENPGQYQHSPVLTVNAELRLGKPIDSVFVSWSADITARYDTDDQRVSQADVRINGISLVEYPDRKGVYFYPDPAMVVQSGETYYLEVHAGSQSVSSESQVPSLFQFTPLGVAEGDTVRYVPGTSWFSEEFFTLTWPGYENSKIYRVISIADSATAGNFIRDDRNEAKVFKGEPEDRLNPGMWWVADDYARINWMYFNWTGWHSVVVSAMDDNYYDYRNGILFGEQSGQNFNNVVKGGYGLFCASASDTLRIYLVQ